MRIIYLIYFWSVLNRNTVNELWRFIYRLYFKIYIDFKPCVNIIGVFLCITRKKSKVDFDIFKKINWKVISCLFLSQKKKQNDWSRHQFPTEWPINNRSIQRLSSRVIIPKKKYGICFVYFHSNRPIHDNVSIIIDQFYCLFSVLFNMFAW